MIEVNARLICDRCHTPILDMSDVEDVEEARQRVSEGPNPLWCESEDGDDVCARCWETYDARAQPVAESAEILSPERRTSDRPRDTASSSSSENSAERAAALDAAPSKEQAEDESIFDDVTLARALDARTVVPIEELNASAARLREAFAEIDRLRAAHAPKEEAWTTATTSDWSANIAGLEAMGLFRRHAEDLPPRSHVYPASAVDHAFAGLPDSARGFAGRPPHLQPSNLPTTAAGAAGPVPPADTPPCQQCGGPHPFDTSLASATWNGVIRKRGLPDYLCLTCIVRAFVQSGESFTATLWGDDFGEAKPGMIVPAIEVRVNSQLPRDVELVSEENDRLRIQVRELEAAAVARAAPQAEKVETNEEKNV